MKISQNLYLDMLTMKRVHASTKHWGSVVVVIISTSTLYLTLDHKILSRTGISVAIAQEALYWSKL